MAAKRGDQAAPADQSGENHLIIAGTGRAGTSFLVRYLTELGLDTTLTRNGKGVGWDAEANAGLENQLFSGADLPYVVKSPWISEYIDQILKETRFKIDAFIVPVRDLVEAATSRVVLEQRAIHQHNSWMADQLTGHGKPTAIPQEGWFIRSILSIRRDCWRFNFIAWS